MQAKNIRESAGALFDFIKNTKIFDDTFLREFYLDRMEKNIKVLEYAQDIGILERVSKALKRQECDLIRYHINEFPAPPFRVLSIWKDSKCTESHIKHDLDKLSIFIDNFHARLERTDQ